MRTLLLILALIAPLAEARTRAVASRVATARRIVIVIAHPDDEILIAPLLYDRCVRARASCAFVVLTAGENGGDADVRMGEMARAAAMFNARLTQWTYPDVMDNVDETWSAQAGGHHVLVRRLRNAIEAEHPDLILTLDPVHGTTGHPAHRTVGQLVLETYLPNIYLIETVAEFVGEGFILGNGGGDAAWVYRGDWDAVVRDAENHASQFSRAQVESLRNLPEAQQRVWFKPAPAP
jgi:hypothetical protein